MVLHSLDFQTTHFFQSRHNYIRLSMRQMVGIVIYANFTQNHAIVLFRIKNIFYMLYFHLGAADFQYVASELLKHV
jgi:hypothetical protein